ncbi:MAG: TonB-dependent receptor, partial [Flavobacteriaceae bacterium]|nr:TonB-dependent receptor [Flavobacteriaceae bacterium]
MTDITSGLPLSGATLQIKGTNLSAITNEQGVYIITVPQKGTLIIICRHLGYVSQSKKMSFQGYAEINFEMTPEPEALDEVEVIGNLIRPTKRAGDLLYTGSRITTKGLDIQGAIAQNSIFNSLKSLPSVSVESADPYGLNTTIARIRGIRNYFSGVTLDGIPNYGIMPIGARDEIVDMENIAAITFFKGAVPADVSAASGNRGGTINVTLKKPDSVRSFNSTQSMGSDHFNRTFLRFDSGKLSSKTAFFGSFSYTYADKWKGEGPAGKRNHLAFGLSQQIGSKLAARFFSSYNVIDKNAFRPLLYAEIDDLKNNYDLDYNTLLTGIPSEDLYYFDYNKGSYKNRKSFVSVDYKATATSTLGFKAYLNTENASYSNTLKMGNNNLKQDKTRDLNQWGLMANWTVSFRKLQTTLGYWFESFDNSVSIYNNSITPQGLSPKGYAFYTVPEGQGSINNPYLKLAYSLHKFKFQAGIKYLHFKEPAAERFLALNADALRPEPEADLHTDAIDQSVFLPTFGVGYKFKETAEIYVNYGKNYMRPYMYIPTVSLYLQNRAGFLESNRNLQSVFGSWDLEVSDNIDLGFLFTSRILSLNTSLFYSKQQNTLAVVFDSEVGLNYAQNVGAMTSYGVELEANAQIMPSLTWYFNPSFMRLYFDSNYETNSSSGVQLA